MKGRTGNGSCLLLYLTCPFSSKYRQLDVDLDKFCLCLVLFFFQVVPAPEEPLSEVFE